MIAPPQANLVAEKKRIGEHSRNELAVATAWTGADQAAYHATLSFVHNSALMISPDHNAELLVFTDASLSGYTIIVTQMIDWDPWCRAHNVLTRMILFRYGTD
jgi:hypothetical protein